MNTGVSGHWPETIVLKKAAASSSKRFPHLQWRMKGRKLTGQTEQRIGPVRQHQKSYRFKSRTVKPAWYKTFLQGVEVEGGHPRNYFYRPFFKPYRTFPEIAFTTSTLR